MSEGPRPPFYRNPWIIALVAGIVTITLIRPLTRHEPDAPPPLGAVPEFRFGGSGAIHGSADLAGQPYVLGIVAGACESSDCQAVVTGLKHIQKNYDLGDFPIRVVTLRLDPTAETPTPSQVVLDASAEEARPLLLAMAALAEAELNADSASSLGLMVADGQGRARGFYRVDEEGVDEALHRATHVLKEERSR